MVNGADQMAIERVRARLLAGETGATPEGVTIRGQEGQVISVSQNVSRPRLAAPPTQIRPVVRQVSRAVRRGLPSPTARVGRRGRKISLLRKSGRGTIVLDKLDIGLLSLGRFPKQMNMQEVINQSRSNF